MIRGPNRSDWPRRWWGPPAPQRSVAQAAEAFDARRSAVCRERKLGLTKLHNLLEAGELPDLQAAYDELNDSVTAVYGFPAGSWRDDLQTLKLLLALNYELAGGGSELRGAR
jgi:hypothetical protein